MEYAAQQGTPQGTSQETPQERQQEISINNDNLSEIGLHHELADQSNLNKSDTNNQQSVVSQQTQQTQQQSGTDTSANEMVPDMEVYEKNNPFYFIVNGKYSVRLKKKFVLLFAFNVRLR